MNRTLPVPQTLGELVDHLIASHGEDYESLMDWMIQRSDPNSWEGHYPDNTPFQHLSDSHLFIHDNSDNEPFNHRHEGALA